MSESRAERDDPSGTPAEPLSPTEEVNPASIGIDDRDTLGILKVIHQQDGEAFRAVETVLEPLSRLVDTVVAAFREGGRLIYCGAGTSGRLGVLDAAECPPTFGVEPSLVQGLIAGDDAALRCSVEGAEDSPGTGVAAMRRAMVEDRDVVCGIAASGTTPYVWGAIEEAKRRDATTALIHCNPHLPSWRSLDSIDHLLTLDVGPEVIAGSTRMKGGTATKMVLGMLTSATMIRWGKVYDNLMVDVVPSSRKLRRRARLLVERLVEVDSARAEELLRAAGGRVKMAVVMGRAGLSSEEARNVLERNDGLLRKALIDVGASLPPGGVR